MKTKKHTSCPVNKTPERDLYQLVTDRVIEAIEKGVAPGNVHGAQYGLTAAIQ